MDFDRSLIRQRNDELTQEVRIGRLKKRLRSDRERSSRRARAEVDERGGIGSLMTAARASLFTGTEPVRRKAAHGATIVSRSGARLQKTSKGGYADMTRKALLRTERAKLTLALVVAVLAAMLAVSGYGTPAARAQSAPGCDGPWGPGNWPPACWRPYADTSPFNIPLPANPKPFEGSQEASQKIVDRIINNVPYGTPDGGIAKRDYPAHFVVHTDGSSGEPTYYSQPTDPEFTLHCTYNGDPDDPLARDPAAPADRRPWGICPLEGEKVRIPVGARTEGNVAAGNTGSKKIGGTGMFDYWTQPDAHMTIIDQTAGVEYDLWQVHTNSMPAGGGDLYFSWGGLTKLNGNGLASDELEKDSSGNPVPNAVVGDATAARFGSLAGRVRAEEFAAGKIDHALFIGVDCTRGKSWNPEDKSFVYPARKFGRPCSQVKLPNGSNLSDVNAPPMGARLQLNMSATDIDALPVPEWKKTLLHAMSKYGAFIGDTGCSGYFCVEMESGNQYTSLSSGNKWNSFAASNGWPLMQPDGGYPFERYHGEMGRFADGIDWKSQVWSKLRVVDPCVSDGSCDPPMVTKPRPAPGSSTTDRTPPIKATVRDAHTNLAKADIQLSLDGRQIATFAYDRATDRLSYTPGRNLSLGGHKVKVQATDAAGNVATKQWSFKVVR